MRTSVIAVVVAVLWLPCLLGGIEDTAADTTNLDPTFGADASGWATLSAWPTGQTPTEAARVL